MSYSLNVKNFQGIRDLTFEVSGFTVLKGPTDSGKSSVRRALDFLLRNNWDKSFLRKGETLCEVSLEAPGLKIERKKSKKENSYSVTVNGETTNYDKIGTDVPDQFSGLGLTPLKAEDIETDLNIYRQRDRMFLVQYSAAERTKVLNTLFKVGKFETAARLVKKDLINLRTDVNALGASIESDKEAIRKYEEILPAMRALRESCWWFSEGAPQYLELLRRKSELEGDLDFLDTKVKSLEFLGKDLESVDLLTQIMVEFEVKKGRTKVVASIEKALEEFRSLLDLLDAESLLESYQDLGAKRSSLFQRVEVIDRSLTGFQSLQESLEALTSLDDYLVSVGSASLRSRRVSDLDQALGKLNLMESWLEAMSDLEQYQGLLVKAVRDQEIVNILKNLDDSCKLWLISSIYIECEEKASSFRKILESLESQLVEERKSVCPTCGRPWEVLSEHQHL